MTTRLILCADDYGLSEGQSQAILDLAQRRRISATSAVVTAPDWRSAARALVPLRPTLAVGLHLNLTEGAPLGAMPRFARGGVFPSILRAVSGSLMRTLPVDELRDEIARQVREFQNALGAPPDFIDGHQHVHALPQVGDFLLAVLEDIDPQRRVLLRDPADLFSRIVARRLAITKAGVLTLLTRTFGPKARALGYRTNDGFSGVSHFVDTPQAVTRDFQSATTYLGPRHIMMCHPGFHESAQNALEARRALEFSALMSHEALSQLVWQPQRDAGGAIVWPRALPDVNDDR